MAQNTGFKRVVLGLDRSSPDRAALRLAAELAELLRLDLFGVFAADDSVLNLAGMPFARELRALGGGWRPLDVGELDRDLDMSARGAQRLFEDAAKALRTASRFEVRKGSASQAIASVMQAGDIVMIAEPRTPAAQLTRPFSALVEAALQSAASVMLVPSRIVRQYGPVVAIAAEPEDPCIACAMALAAAAKEDVVLVEAHEAGAARGPRLGAIAAATGIHVASRSARGLRLTDEGNISAVFAPLRERLVVMSRSGSDGRTPALIASVRRVPVLVVETAAGDVGDDRQ